MNTKTEKYLFGSDYRYHPPHQRTSKKRALTYETMEDAIHDMKHRKCGLDYRVVEINVELVRVLDLKPSDLNNLI